MLTLAAALCNLALATVVHSQDTRFRVYGPAIISDHQFSYRGGGGSFDGCATDDNPDCKADFYTLGQLNDRKIGPYADFDDGRVFQRFGFLRASRPTHWDCHIGLDLSVTNWFTTTRCIDQLGAEAYQELVRLVLGVKEGEEYKRDVLSKTFDAEKSMLHPFMHHYLDAHNDTNTIVLEIGNEPNVHPAMDPGTYAWYFKLYAEAARDVALAVGKERNMIIDLQLMSAGLWIFNGMPPYIVDTLNQGAEVSLGRIPFAPVSIPVGIKYCRIWGFKFPCGLRQEIFDRTAGVDFKFKVYTDAQQYFDDFIKAVAPTKVDIAGFHFYPYVGEDASFGESNTDAHIKALNSLATHAASLVQTHTIWLTELGNFNPFSVDDTVTKVASPILTALKKNAIPAIKRWYWFKNAGNDKKIKLIPKLDGTVVALALLGIDELDTALGPLVTIERPRLAPETTNSIVYLVNQFHTHEPQQGLYNDTDKDMDLDHLSPLGMLYHNFAMIPDAVAQCDGSPNGFVGCRGNGCSVCTEILAIYPKYFQNRPNCIPNPTCEGEFYPCNAACTAPMGFDQ